MGVKWYRFMVGTCVFLIAHDVEQLYAFTGRLGFDLFRKRLADFFSEGPHSKCLGLWEPHLMTVAFFSFLLTTLKKKK